MASSWNSPIHRCRDLPNLMLSSATNQLDDIHILISSAVSIRRFLFPFFGSFSLHFLAISHIKKNDASSDHIAAIENTLFFHFLIHKGNKIFLCQSSFLCIRFPICRSRSLIFFLQWIFFNFWHMKMLQNSLAHGSGTKIQCINLFLL